MDCSLSFCSSLSLLSLSPLSLLSLLSLCLQCATLNCILRSDRVMTRTIVYCVRACYVHTVHPPTESHVNAIFLPFSISGLSLSECVRILLSFSVPEGSRLARIKGNGKGKKRIGSKPRKREEQTAKQRGGGGFPLHFAPALCIWP